MNEKDLYILRDKIENPNYHFINDDTFIAWVCTEGMPNTITEIERLQEKVDELQDTLAQADILIATLTPNE